MFLRAKTVRQVAALPFVYVEGAPEFLLVTSRERKRTIIPKGWPKKGMSFAETAAQEAEEEAGVTGWIAQNPIGYFRYGKRMSKGYEVPVSVGVYPLLVRHHALDWREREQRRLTWLSHEDAVKSVADAGLRRLLKRLSRGEFASLKALRDEGV